MGEILDVLKYWRYWFFKAIFILQNRYKDTLLGLFWEPFSLLFVTVCISLIWSQVLGEKEFLGFFLYVFIGYYSWGLLSEIVQDGVRVFEKHLIDLVNENRNLLFYVLEDLTFSFIKFIVVFPLVFLIIGIFGDANFIYGSILALFVLIFIFLSSVGFMIISGTISLFFNDVRQVIQSVMRLAFLLTPIIWRPERLGEYVAYVWFNPFYVYVHAMRQVLLDGKLDAHTMTVLLFQTISLFVTGMFILSHVELKVRKQAFIS